MYCSTQVIPHFLTGLFLYFFKEREGTKEVGVVMRETRREEGKKERLHSGPVSYCSGRS